MKSRLAHLAAIVGGAAMTVLGILAVVPYPKVAIVAGSLLSAIGDIRKALGNVDVAKPTVGLFILLLLGHVLFGCAHLSAVEAKCNVTTQDLFDVTVAALGEDYEAALSPAAIQKEFCVVKAAAGELLALRRPAVPPPPVVVMMAHLSAWTVAHGGAQ